MDTIRINKISEVIAGYSFREALKANDKGGVLVFQAQNISDDASIKYDLTRIDFDLPRTKSFIQAEDVLLSARGTFKAKYIDRYGLPQTVASSSVYILRVNSEKILPEYLSIYLNSKQGQNNIRKNITGTTIKTILKADLENIEIVLPSLDIQRRIIGLKKNWLEREKLLKKKIKVSESISEATINMLLTKNI